MMELLYRGFDGLDISFQAQIPPALCRSLEDAKEKAQRFRSTAHIEVNGVGLEVFESGARGGYAFMASSGEFGATWFFKRPNHYDPWGVRVSCNSFFLATSGLGQARSALYGVLDALDIVAPPGSESIGRIDYALDYLAPDFVLVPDHFVMHSNARRKDHHDLGELSVTGRSGKVTSVTVGTMPGRQVIAYDKRTEIISKRKPGWWEIWDATRAKAGREPLVRDCPSLSAVWRVELRAGKHHLKERWKIRSWSDLDARLGDMIAATLDAVRHTSPTFDTNRSRWPDSPLWQAVRQAAQHDLFEMRNYAPPDLVKQVQRDEHVALLTRQMEGLLTSKAAILGVTAEALPDFAKTAGKEMAKHIDREPDHFARRLADAGGRYQAIS